MPKLCGSLSLSTITSTYTQFIILKAGLLCTPTKYEQLPSISRAIKLGTFS